MLSKVKFFSLSISLSLTFQEQFSEAAAAAEDKVRFCGTGVVLTCI